MRDSKPLCKLADFSNKVKTLLLAMASYNHLAQQSHKHRQYTHRDGLQVILVEFPSWELPRLTRAFKPILASQLLLHGTKLSYPV